jgi:ribosomal protein S18 acetylase RimI-like enzyme
VVLRRVVPSDWPALRSLRLEALQDTPVAYCESRADALRVPDEGWQARTARGAEGGDAFQVLAWLGGAPVATAVGFLDGGDAVLAAVYVSLAWRGRGLLDRMVDEVAGWAVSRSAPRLRLLVHESNAPARRAYERLGFTATGHREPYPLDPATDEVELACALPRGRKAAATIG